MKLIQATETYLVFQGMFGTAPVRYIFNRADGEMFIHSQDLAKALGFSCEQEMCSSDAILDILNEMKEESGSFPLVKLDFDEK